MLSERIRVVFQTSSPECNSAKFHHSLSIDRLTSVQMTNVQCYRIVQAWGSQDECSSSVWRPSDLRRYRYRESELPCTHYIMRFCQEQFHYPRLSLFHHTSVLQRQRTWYMPLVKIWLRYAFRKDSCCISNILSWMQLCKIPPQPVHR